MRTRRSWRNQNRLFKELFKPADQPVAVVPILTDVEINAMFWIPKTSRNLMKRDAAKRRAPKLTEKPMETIHHGTAQCGHVGQIFKTGKCAHCYIADLEALVEAAKKGCDKIADTLAETKPA